jgi:hypothetical protein
LQKLLAESAGLPRQMVYNALNQSELLSEEDIAYYRLNEAEPLHWKLLAAGKSTKVVLESEVSHSHGTAMHDTHMLQGCISPLMLIIDQD